MEYTLLVTMHLFFLLAFRSLYSPWMALALGGAVFGMNFQLTQLREARRTANTNNRKRFVADTFESILFLLFIVLLSAGGLLRNMLEIGDQEYLAYVASILGSLFLAGLVGEMYWQYRHFRTLDEERQRNYVENLKRTIILPYTLSRRR